MYATAGIPMELKTNPFSFRSNSGMFSYITPVAKMQSAKDCAPSTSGMDS